MDKKSSGATKQDTRGERGYHEIFQFKILVLYN